MKGLLTDEQIAYRCIDESMLDPFIPDQCGKPSYGLGSVGYDLRLGTKFLVHQAYKTECLDPRQDNSCLFKLVEVYDVFYLQPHTQVLGETAEWFNMPEDVTSIILGKSSYARLGLLVNCTPAEPGWRGILTLELANLSALPIALHVGQGIAQALFFQSDIPDRTYAEKETNGGYQNQKGVTLPNQG